LIAQPTFPSLTQSIIPTITFSNQPQISSNWQEFSNTNGYSFSYPSSMRVITGGFGYPGRESNPNIHIFSSTATNGVDQPHVDIAAVTPQEQG